ncbi:MAG: GNAT family N-acetyltransferase [Chitinophagaceae bacterium]|nr:GNAT family N-acetyltransferase [Rubrivivax sp.]
MLQEALQLAGSTLAQVTDESSAIEALGHAPLLVPGEIENLKLTWPGDLPLAERWLAARAAAHPAITFRRLTDADLPMLHGWLHRPHVARWWLGEDDPPTLQDTVSDYGAAALAQSSDELFIAHAAAEPIGFIQSYVAKGSGDGWWEDEVDPGVRGVDQFLSDGDRLNQGLGTRMLGAFVARLFQDTAVTRVQADPHPANTRAIRCYSKVGFKPVREITTPDGPALLMVMERPAAAGATNP